MTVFYTDQSETTRTPPTYRPTSQPLKTGNQIGRCISIQKNAQWSEPAATSASESLLLTSLLHGHVLDIVDCSKYLGVNISEDLTWKKHVDNTAAADKASRTLGFLRRNLRDCRKEARSAAYNAMVQPTLQPGTLIPKRTQIHWRRSSAEGQGSCVTVIQTGPRDVLLPC